MVKKSFLLIFFSIILFSSLVNASILDDNQLFWKFNNRINESVALQDLSSNSYDGTNVGADFSSDGFYFADGLDEIKAGDILEYQELSVGAWVVRNGTLDPASRIIEKYYGSPPVYTSYCLRGGQSAGTKHYFEWEVSHASGYEYVTSSTESVVGQEYCVVGTWNAGDMRLYVDGILEDNKSVTANTIPYNTERFHLAQYGNTSTNRWIGGIKVSFVNNRSMTESEILDFCSKGSDYNPYLPEAIFIPPSPENASSNNTQVTFNINCSGNYVYAWLDGNLTINNAISPANFTTNVNTSGEYTIKASCTDGLTFSDNVTRIWYYDAIYPAISTDFINNSVTFQTLIAQFNFTDDFYLNSYNITIDGQTISYNDSLTGTSFQVNLSYNLENITTGEHILGVKLADGHTANKINPYEVSTGLFNNYLEYGYNDKGINKKVKISNENYDLFDTFSTKKEIDRYTWNFKPNKKKSSYTFDIETDDEIRIIEDDNTYLKKWITFGNKWIDFDMPDEDETIIITKVNDKHVKVTIGNIKDTDKLKFKSIGDLNIIEANYTFYNLNASVTYQDTIFEGSITSLTLNLYMPDLLDFQSNASLIWNSTSKNVTRTNISDDEIDYISTFVVPELSTNSTNWTYYFEVNGSLFNISGMSMYVEMNITNCSAGNYIVLNYTIYDEETQEVPTGVNATIENYLTLTTPDYEDNYYNFSIKEEDTNLLICLPNNTLANSTFILDARTKYYYDDHVEEYHYIENFNLTADVIPKTIKLYDLLSADSTSFLVTYQDDNYLYVEGVVIDLLRQYTYLNGDFYSVEHGKTDQNGQTPLHLVTEDVIYKANVWLNGVLQHSEGEFQAICQASPCQINLRKAYDTTEGLSEYENIVYSITSQEDFYTAKAITFDFSTNDGTSTKILMNVTQSTNLLNDTICSSSKTLSAGSIVCTIPITYYNSTYLARVYKDGEFLGWRTYTLEPNADDIFGRTGVWLGGIGYLLLAFMGVASPSASLVLGVIGFISMGSMNLLIKSSVYGIGSSIIWLIIAVGILIWKYQQRRVQ